VKLKKGESGLRFVLWQELRSERVPPSGWIKAVRLALGMTTYQLAIKLGINQANAQRLEKRESEGSITLKAIKNATASLDCKLIYAIVPNDEYSDLNDIIEKHAKEFSLKILNKTDHTMKLEKQGVATDNTELDELTKELKDSFDSRIWDQ